MKENLFALIILVVVCDRRKYLHALSSERRIRAEETVKPCSNSIFLSPLSFRYKTLVLTRTVRMHIYMEVTDGLVSYLGMPGGMRAGREGI